MEHVRDSVNKKTNNPPPQKYTVETNVTVHWGTIVSGTMWVYINILLSSRFHVNKKRHLAHLGASHTDDAVGMPIGIVEERDSDRMLAGWDPVALSSWIDLEYVRPGTENGLLPARERENDRTPDQKYAFQNVYTCTRTLNT